MAAGGAGALGGAFADLGEFGRCEGMRRGTPRAPPSTDRNASRCYHWLRRPINSQKVSEDLCSHPLTICSHIQTELLVNMGGLGVSCEQPVEGVNDTFLRLGTCYL